MSIKQVLYIASYENVRFKGGIYTIANALLASPDLFRQGGYRLRSVSSCQLKSRNIKNIGRFRLENILNAFRVLKEISKSEKNAPSDVVYCITSTALGFLKDLVLIFLIKKRWKHKKVVLNIQFAELEIILPANKVLKDICLSILDKQVDQVLVQNVEVRDDLIALVGNLRVAVLPNFYWVHKDYLKYEVTKNVNQLRVLYLAMIDERKGFDLLINLMNELKPYNIILDVCGGFYSEDFKDKCLDQIKRNNIKSITFYGFVENDKKSQLIQDADVNVLLSSGEGMAMALLETMAYGKAVVLSDISSNKAVVAGFDIPVFDRNDTEKLKDYFVNLLEDRDLLERQKKLSIDCVSKFSIENHIVELCKSFA